MRESSNMESHSVPAGDAAAIDWEARYRVGDTPWEKGRPHPGLVWWLKERTLTGRIAVPGCGSGHDVRYLAAKGASVLGLDLAESAIKSAAKYPLVGTEEYHLCDICRPASTLTGTFDHVFEHTCFCALHPSQRDSYLSGVTSLLKPGGTLLAIFYLNPDHEEPGPPFRIARPELLSLLSKHYHPPHFEATGIPTYPGRESRELLIHLRKKA